MKPEFYRNFEMSLNKLNQFVAQGIKDELDRAGLIQGFEFVFEQAWKAIQKKGTEDSVAINSPKQAFSWAIELRWIERQDEALWIQILNDRNQTTHTYKEDLAKSVADHVARLYAPAFASLLEKMKST